jgi:hypothetical protein
MQMGRPGYACRLFARNWRAKPRSAKRLALYVMARLGFGKQRFFRVAEAITRFEERMRPTAVRAPERTQSKIGTANDLAATH